MVSIQARKQRKARANAPLHERRKAIASHLSKELREKYNRRAITVRKGDTVKVIRGSFKGHTDKVSDVDTKAYKIYIEGLTLSKSDGKKVARPVDPSNVILTKLDLSDKYRREKLGETEVPVEEKAKAAPAVAKAEAKAETKEASK
ncbi:MAG: 50S ribosomal protein L24 [Candidatus Thermoplasmatota archaeon]|nr:50S ribosomal protein L24 [Candidatus Thermoplasmatota archaeon]